MKKFILSFAIFIVLLLASAIFLPYLLKDKIIEAVKVEANKSLKAELDFNNNISINIFKSFPNLNLGFKDVTIIYDSGTFVNDTFLNAEKIELSMDLMKFYKEQEYIVKSLNLIQPNLYLEFKDDSTYNWDIAVSDESTEDTSASPFNLEIESFKIQEGLFVYNDIEADLLTQLQNINHTSSGTFNPEKLVLAANTTIDQLLVTYDGVTYLNNWEISQDGNFDLDLKNEIYGLPKNELKINGLPTILDGDIRFKGDDMLFNIIAKSTTPDINRFLTLIPAIYTSDFASTKTKGESKLDFTFKGIYNETSFPAYDLKLLIKNGWLKYPDLPLPAENLQLDLHVFSKDGDVDKTVIDIQKLHFKLAQDPFDLTLKMQDIFGNPLIDLSSRGAINLDNLTKIVPLEDTELAGRLSADLDIKGRSNAISNSEIDKFYASGQMQSSGLVYKTSYMPERLEVSKANLIFNNQKVTIPTFAGKLGENDIEISAVLDNFFGYMINNQTLKGDVQLKSRYLNTNDFLTDDSSSDSMQMTVVEIPGNINLDLNASISKMIYDDLIFSNFSGNLTVENQAVKLKNIATDLLGGRLTMDGAYQYDVTTPRANFEVSYSNIEVADLFSKFKLVKAFAPIAEQIQAITTAKLSFASDLNQDMSPKLSNVNLGGALNLENIKVAKMEVLQSLDSKLGTQHFNIQKLNDLLLKFNIKEGKLFVDPFNLWIDESKLSLSGISKVDGTINYEGMLSIPATYVKNEAKYINNITQGSAFQSLNINPEEYLNIAINILGTVKKPEIKLNLKEIKQGIKQTLKDAVSSEIDKTKTQLEDKAKTEADKLKSEAEQKAKEAEAKLKAELDKKKAEADAKLRAEAEAQKKKLEEEKARIEEEAKKKLKNLIKKK